jgi:hypothetical protein
MNKFVFKIWKEISISETIRYEKVIFFFIGEVIQ